MAVIKSKRHTSPILFLSNLKTIELDLFRHNQKIPKKYRPFNEKFIINPIALAYSYATVGNSFYLSSDNKNSLVDRETYFNKAINNLMIANSQIEIVIEMNYQDSITTKEWLDISTNINNCITMLQNIIRSDKKRMMECS